MQAVIHNVSQRLHVTVDHARTLCGQSLTNSKYVSQRSQHFKVAHAREGLGPHVKSEFCLRCFRGICACLVTGECEGRF